MEHLRLLTAFGRRPQNARLVVRWHWRTASFRFDPLRVLER